MWECSVPPLPFFCQSEMVLIEVKITSGEKPSEDTEDQNSSGSWPDLSDACGAFPWPRHGVQSSNAHGIFIRLDQILSHQTNHNELKYIHSTNSNHNGFKLEISKKDSWNIPRYLGMKQHTLNNPRVKEEMTREMRKYFELTHNENRACQNLWNVVKVVERKF